MGHEVKTLLRGIDKIHREIVKVETAAEFKAFRERWCEPWSRTIRTLDDNPFLKRWVINHWEHLKPRILVQQSLAMEAWKCAKRCEEDLQMLSALD